jgi:hypothetical protein
MSERERDEVFETRSSEQTSDTEPKNSDRWQNRDRIEPVVEVPRDNEEK